MRVASATQPSVQSLSQHCGGTVVQGPAQPGSSVVTTHCIVPSSQWKSHHLHQISCACPRTGPSGVGLGTADICLWFFPNCLWLWCPGKEGTGVCRWGTLGEGLHLWGCGKPSSMLGESFLVWLLWSHLCSCRWPLTHAHSESPMKSLVLSQNFCGIMLLFVGSLWGAHRCLHLPEGRNILQYGPKECLGHGYNTLSSSLIFIGPEDLSANSSTHSFIRFLAVHHLFSFCSDTSAWKSQDVFLNPELGWWPASPRESPVSTHPDSAGVTDTGATPNFLLGCWGFELRSSCLYSKHSFCCEPSLQTHCLYPL